MSSGSFGKQVLRVRKSPSLFLVTAVTMASVLIGCGEVRTQVTQLKTARFAGKDSIVYERAQYTWVESNIGDGGAWKENARAQFIDADFSGTRKSVMLDFPSLGNGSVWLQEFRNGFLEYDRSAREGADAVKYLTSTGTGESQVLPLDGTISLGRNYLTSSLDVYSITSGKKIDSLGTPSPNVILFFDEATSTYIIKSINKGVAYLDLKTGALDPIRTVPHSVFCTYADDGKSLLFKEWPDLKFYTMRISDIQERSKAVRPLSVPPGYLITDVQGDSLLLLVKDLRSAESCDTLLVTDIQGNVRAKIGGAP